MRMSRHDHHALNFFRFCALQANDTMKSWKTSAPEERATLLDQFLGKQSYNAAEIIKCLNETSEISGHSELQIAEVVKFCTSSERREQPV